MKKLIATTIAVLLIFINLAPAAFAADSTKVNYERIEFENGDYAIVTIEYETATKSSGTVSGSKNYVYKNSSGDVQWTVKLSGTFSYNGSSATCTSASATSSITNTAWKIPSAIATKSGNTATGNYTAKKYLLGVVVQTEYVQLTLSCSAGGTLS